MKTESTSKQDKRQATPETEDREGGKIIDSDACFENILESLINFQRKDVKCNNYKISGHP